MLEGVTSLLTDCLQLAQYVGFLVSFRTWLIIGAVAAVLTWIACFSFSKLWNRHYHRKPFHYFLSTFAGLVTLMMFAGFFTLNNLKEITMIYIKTWSIELKVDQNWSANTFEKAYYAVKELGKEDFNSVPMPEITGSFIPIDHSESRVEAAYTYTSEAFRNFNEKHPFLAMILSPDVDLTEEKIKTDIDHYMAGKMASNPVEEQFHYAGLEFSSIQNLLESAVNSLSEFSSWNQTGEDNAEYPTHRAIDLAGTYLQVSLGENSSRVVMIGRFALIGCFLLLQAVPFGLIGYAAYRDIKIQ